MWTGLLLFYHSASKPANKKSSHKQDLTQAKFAKGRQRKKATQKGQSAGLIKSVKIGTTSVACFQPGGIHIYRRQIVQCRKIVPHLCVITPQKLVGCSSHVDVEGFTLAALSVKELKYRLIQRRAFEVYPHMMPVIQSRFFKRSAVDDILRISGKECADTRTNYNRM